MWDLHYAHDGRSALLEIIWGVPYFAVMALVAFKNIRFSTALIGAFWCVHGVYGWMHEVLITNVGVPSWYPALCAADFVIGPYLNFMSRRIPFCVCVIYKSLG